ncbi:MAG: 50S ribosomal protein L21, partial [Bradymonadaceae bacterium]
MHAIIKTGGKQYRLEPGDEVDIEKLGDVDAGGEVTFEKVLAAGDGDDLDIGRPYLDDVDVVGEVLEHGRGPKKL